jgi:hypothetical protein
MNDSIFKNTNFLIWGSPEVLAKATIPQWAGLKGGKYKIVKLVFLNKIVPSIKFLEHFIRSYFLIWGHPEAIEHPKLASSEGVLWNILIFALNRPLLKLNSKYILFNAFFDTLGP